MTSVAEPVAAALEVQNLRRLQEAIEDRRGAGHVADQLAPVLERAVARHHRALDLMPPHDDLEEGGFSLCRARDPAKLV